MTVWIFDSKPMEMNSILYSPKFSFGVEKKPSELEYITLLVSFMSTEVNGIAFLLLSTVTPIILPF